MNHWAFDLDGTLVDSFPAYFETMARIYRRHGTVFRPEQHHEALTRPLIEMFAEHLGPDAVPVALAQLQSESNEAAERIRPFEGIPELLRRLRERGARAWVWTNRDLDSASRILRASGVGELIEGCISGTCVSRRKPHPEGLLTISRHYGCPPEAIIHVGDHEHDIEGAHAAGARGLRASWHPHWEIADCRISHRQFRRVAELADWIDAPAEPRR